MKMGWTLILCRTSKDIGPLWLQGEVELSLHFKPYRKDVSFFFFPTPKYIASFLVNETFRLEHFAEKRSWKLKHILGTLSLIHVTVTHARRQKEN